MKSERLSEAISQIDASFIEKTARLRNKKKNSNLLYRFIATAACFCLVFTVVILAFNENSVKAENLMDGIKPRDIAGIDDLSQHSAHITDFALTLLNNTMTDGENILLSPLSILSAVAMTSNGADGNTLAQIESVLGTNINELNVFMYSYEKELKKDKIKVANSIWFKEDAFTVNPDFLQLNADYYGADIYKAPFDERTLKDINNWVDDKTDGQIPQILDVIPENSVMYLVNALAFKDKWLNKYSKNSIKNGKFTFENGETADVEYMYSVEEKYLKLDNARGFIKYYKNDKYAFAVLLPNKNTSVSDMLNTLDGEKISSVLSSPINCNVEAAIPKFESSYSVELSNALKRMGMSDAFDSNNADFGKLGACEEGNVYINRILHKSFISVDKKGSKVAASTAVEQTYDISSSNDEMIIDKRVYLDRPFLYMIIDCETNVPLFIGTMMNPNS